MSKEKQKERELIKKNQELKQLNEELDAFVYSSSHDLRAPLTSVQGLVSLIEEETNIQKIYYLNYLIKESIERLLKVTDDMVDYSRNARTEIEKEEVTLLDLIDSTIVNHSFVENFHRLKIKIDINNPPEKIFLEKKRFEILFNNFLSNAIKYQDTTKEFSYLIITVNFFKENFELIFEDNGIGIEPVHQEKVFDMFYRANAYSLGSGLGLYIVKGIIGKLNGKIDLKSTFQKGTIFTLTFPY